MFNIIATLSLVLILHSSLVFPNEIMKNELIKVNRIEIHYYKGKKVDYKTRRSIDLQYLKALIINCKNDRKLKYDTTGEIIYFQNEKALFTAYFCTQASRSKYKNGVVMFQYKNHKIQSLLNYGSGMLIDEEFYQLNK